MSRILKGWSYQIVPTHECEDLELAGGVDIGLTTPRPWLQVHLIMVLSSTRQATN